MRRGLLGIEDLTREEIEAILQRARDFQPPHRQPFPRLETLRGKVVVNLFFEPSTRTRTSFEIAAKRLGADAVGMSTVPEVIVANQLGMKVLGLSCLTNMAASHHGKRLSHLDVLTVTAQAADRIRAVLRGVIRELPSPGREAGGLPSGGGEARAGV